MADDLQAVAERSARELAALRRLVLVVMAVAIVTALVAIWQVQEIARVRTQISRLQTGLTAEADRRLQALTPELEARAQRIESSADRADRAVQGLDAKIDAAGDRIADKAVERVEQQLPGFIDRYLASRLPR
jgi:uncharacterized protein HemX